MDSLPANSPQPVSMGDLFDSVYLWMKYLLRQKWIIIAVTILCVIVGFYIGSRDKPKYQSHLTFVLEETDGGLGGAINLAAEFGLNLGSSNNLFQGDNIISLLTSRRIVERVLLSADTVNAKPVTLADYYISIINDTTQKAGNQNLHNIPAWKKVSFPVNVPRSSFTYLQDSVLMTLYLKLVNEGQLQVSKPDKKYSLYEVSVTSTDERFTKIFTERVAKEASEFYTELKSRRSRQTLEILERRVAETRGNLNTAITNRAAIQDADINPAFQMAQAQTQKKQVDISAYGGAYAELYKNLEVARYQYLKDIPLLQVIDGADYPMQKVKRGKLITAVIYGVFALFACLAIFTVIFVFAGARHKYIRSDHRAYANKDNMPTA